MEEVQIKGKTLLDEHIYLPAKFLWAVITVAVGCIGMIAGGVFWLSSVKAEQRVQSEKLQKLENLNERVIKIETVQTQINTTMIEMRDDVKTLLIERSTTKTR